MSGRSKDRQQSVSRQKLSMFWRLKRFKRVIVWIIAIALLIKLAFFRHWKGSTLSTSPIVDSPLLLTRPNYFAAPAYQQVTWKLKNPLDLNQHHLSTDPGLTFQHIPKQAQAGIQDKVIFHCSHEDESLCPQGYRVWMLGPALHSPQYADSIDAVNPRTIQVWFTIKDPGEYKVFAYPEHENCGQWANGPIIYNTLAVSGSPATLMITGPSPLDGFQGCNVTEPIPAGRWISKAHIDPVHSTNLSPHRAWISKSADPFQPYRHTTIYGHVYQPYQCKIEHNPFNVWLDKLKAERLVIFGDSVLRDFYCLLLYPSIGGPGELRNEMQCEWPKYGNATQTEIYYKSDKNMTYTREDGGSTDVRFSWLPRGSLDRLEKYVSALPGDPTHILIGIALHLAANSLKEYAQTMTHVLKFLTTRYPTANILARTSASAVQSIQCYDRIGGQRHRLEALNNVLIGVLKQFPTVELLDSYRILNDAPQTSSDGRHFAGVPDITRSRPDSGSGEYFLGDAMFHHWSQKSL